MAPPWRPHPGTTLDGRYAIERVLGEGPTGVVYAAEDILQGEAVAIKVLHPTLFTGAAQGPNLLRLQRARAYVHDNVVRLRDVVVGERVYTVTELVEAPSLARILTSRGPLLRREILPLLGGVVDALGWIHQIGVHGNLKPANIFVEDGGRTRLSDPWFLEGAGGIASGELLPRSQEWLAPEQLDEGWVERKEADVYALARILSRLVAGRAVEPGESLVEQGIALSAEVDAVLVRATATQPGSRFGTIPEFWEAVNEAWDGDAMRSRPITADRAGRGAAAGASGGLAGKPAGQGQLESKAREGGATRPSKDDEPESSDDEDQGLVDLLDDAGIVVGSETESIPLSEILAMGLDPVLDDNTEEVEAIVLEGPHPEEWSGAQMVAAEAIIELSADDFFDDAVEEVVGAEEVIALGEADLVDVGPVMGAVDPSEVEAIVEAAPEQEEEIAATLAVMAAPTMSAAALANAPGGAASAATAVASAEGARAAHGEALSPAAAAAAVAQVQVRPVQHARREQPKRSPLIYLAPIALLGAVVVAWFVFGQVKERRDVPRTPTTEARALEGAGASAKEAASGSATAGLAAGGTAGRAIAEGAGDALAGAATVTGTEADASVGSGDAGEAAAGAAEGDVVADAGPSEPGDAGEAVAASASDVAAGEAAADAEEETEEGDEEDEEDEEEVVDDGVLAPVEVAPGLFEDAKALGCPGGMARIRRKRTVELANGTKVKGWQVWCIDRFEYPGKGQMPMTGIGLAQAKSICRGKGRRLCTRTEWRGGCGPKYPYGKTYDPARCNTVGADFSPRPLVPAGTNRRCKSGWGVYDMVGNVAEWTSEGYVNGGSSSKDGESGTCYRSSRRMGGGASVGFRCCDDATPKQSGSRK